MMWAAASRSAGVAAPSQVLVHAWNSLSTPSTTTVPDERVSALQLVLDWQRVLLAFHGAAMCIPLGFVIGHVTRLMYKALNPFIRCYAPVSPLAWLPRHCSSFQDSETIAIFVIFICFRLAECWLIIPRLA